MHPFSKWEKSSRHDHDYVCRDRICLIFTTESSNYATVTALNILFATLPTMIGDEYLVHLMACPCAVHESSSSDCMNSFYHCLEKIGSNCALVMLSIGVTFMCFGILMFLESGDEDQVCGFCKFCIPIILALVSCESMYRFGSFSWNGTTDEEDYSWTRTRCHFGASHLGACGFIPFGTWLAERNLCSKSCVKRLTGPCVLVDRE